MTAYVIFDLDIRDACSDARLVSVALNSPEYLVH